LDHCRDMERCLRYIDEHLAEEIVPADLAAMVGYSFFHFCHVFSAWNDVPVGEYVRKRRMSRAARELFDGKSVTEVAFLCGFDTVSGFSRAFSREYGVCPSGYRSAPQKEDKRGVQKMKVRFEKKGEIKTVGYTFAPKDGNRVNVAESGAYWAECDYSGVNVHDYHKLAGKNQGDLGMWYHAEDDGSLVYFFGPIVENFDYVPENMIPVTLPPAEYAIFTSDPVDGRDHKNLIGAARATWKYIFKEWFAGSGYEFDTSRFSFERYWNEAGCDGSDHATVDIYVPVKKK